MIAIGKTICNFLKKDVSALRVHCRNMQIAPLEEIALEERCILVDECDRPLGNASKRHCHEIGKDGNIPLHRAFSVFLFNRTGDLLMQKRSPTKITFPGHFTNTCCSHPLAEIEGETEENEALGIRRAAQRRLGYELGIPPTEAKTEDLYYLTRIHYQAAGHDCWGEHEIDYILFLQVDNVTLDPNPNEISEIRWVPKTGINEFAKTIDAPLTPWFKLILQNQLHTWWDNLHFLQKFQDHKTIHRFLKV